MVSSNMTYIPTQNTQTFQLKTKLTAQAEEKENLIDETLPIARNTVVICSSNKLVQCFDTTFPKESNCNDNTGLIHDSTIGETPIIIQLSVWSLHQILVKVAAEHGGTIFLVLLCSKECSIHLAFYQEQKKSQV